MHVAATTNGVAPTNFLTGDIDDIRSRIRPRWWVFKELREQRHSGDKISKPPEHSNQKGKVESGLLKEARETEKVNGHKESR